jgi:hypothetical protein
MSSGRQGHDEHCYVNLNDECNCGYWREQWRADMAQLASQSARIAALEADLAAAKEREAALAAAIQPFAEFGNRMAAYDDYTYMQDRVKDWLGVSDFKNALTAYACAAPILATVRREAKRKALREWRAKFGHHEPGENTILDEMDAALAALDAEEAQNG